MLVWVAVYNATLFYGENRKRSCREFGVDEMNWSTNSTNLAVRKMASLFEEYVREFESGKRGYFTFTSELRESLDYEMPKLSRQTFFEFVENALPLRFE